MNPVLKGLAIQGLAALGRRILEAIRRRRARKKKAALKASSRSRTSGIGPGLRGIGMRKKRLKTCFHDGRPVEVMITSGRERITVRTFREFDFVKSLPENEIGAALNNGQIFYLTDYRNFGRSIVIFTSLIESVIFSLPAVMASAGNVAVEAEVKVKAPRKRGRRRKNAGTDPGDGDLNSGR